MDHYSKIELHFSSEYSNLYTIGYITTDVNHLLVLSYLIETQDDESIREIFLTRKGPFPITRYSRALREHMDSAHVIEARNGSVELVVEVTGITAIIVIAYIQWRSSTKIKGKSVTFKVSTDDTKLQMLLDHYSAGGFDTDDKALNTLLKVLEKEGYDVEAIAERVFEVIPILEKYGKRIVRVIRAP